MWSYLLYCWTLLHNKLSVVPKFLDNDSSYQGDAEMLLATSCYRKCYNINSSSYEPFGSEASSSTTLKTHQQIGTPTLQAESPSIDQRRAESPSIDRRWLCSRGKVPKSVLIKNDCVYVSSHTLFKPTPEILSITCVCKPRGWPNEWHYTPLPSSPQLPPTTLPKPPFSHSWQVCPELKI